MFIETARLEIREWTIDDFDEFAALMADPEVMQFLFREDPLVPKRLRIFFTKEFWNITKMVLVFGPFITKKKNHWFHGIDHTRDRKNQKN